jgi:MurNAc alpha-1-phosphate uridylyltransferase
MKFAMILAAGEGRRMRPLTDKTPKPLIKVAGKTLLERHIEGLVSAGFTDLVINTSYLADQVVAFCGDGRQWGCRIHLSLEETPLETAGGIRKALPLLTEEVFAVVNSDVFTDYPLLNLQQVKLRNDVAHLVMVPNPSHHPGGDFGLFGGRLVTGKTAKTTFSGLSVMSHRLFDSLETDFSPLRPLFDRAIASQQVSGQLWSGIWSDVGTPSRLSELEFLLRREAR